jgi:probable HAF family extracellular repeat protein
MTDLNSFLPANSGWRLEDATAINDLGQIVGEGTINGQHHAFLLNTADSSATPEPASVALFGAGAALFLLMRKKVQRLQSGCDPRL